MMRQLLLKKVKYRQFWREKKIEKRECQSASGGPRIALRCRNGISTFITILK